MSIIDTLKKCSNTVLYDTREVDASIINRFNVLVEEDIDISSPRDKFVPYEKEGVEGKRADLSPLGGTEVKGKNGMEDDEEGSSEIDRLNSASSREVSNKTKSKSKMKWGRKKKRDRTRNIKGLRVRTRGSGCSKTQVTSLERERA